jgi:histidyl-tRNA synthetase
MKEQVKEKSHLATECDKIGEIAVHYGFTIVKPLHITAEDISKAKHFKDFDCYEDIEEKAALLRWYMEEGQEKLSQPVAIHYKKPLLGSGTKKKPNQEMYGFEIIGSSRPTSEALLIKCTLSVLEELGYDNIYIDINSIGDKESVARFDRELGIYFRKHSNELPAKIRNDFKKNPYSLLLDRKEETREFREGAPQSVATLSEVSRIHFKEVLECLEAFEVAYKINSNIFSNKLCAAYTVFEIRQSSENGGEDELLAYGYRYNYLAKKLGAKKDIPAIGATIIVKKHPMLSKKVIVKNIKKPKFYLVQLGNAAKLKVLNTIEMLRKEKIPVYHSITKDKITGQLTGAEYMHATHVLIIGQKEVVDNTVIVRNVLNREQETVPTSTLGTFLKGL